MSEKKAYLILENGTVFEGKSFGYEKEIVGEVVFTTSVVGYLETLTDPSYYGQLVVQTFPLIGNYGVIEEDFESGKINLNGYVVREWCHNPSNFRSEGVIDTFLKENKIPGLYGIDTRRLTKIIREEGVMNGMITYSKDELEKRLEELKAYKIKDAVKAVTCEQAAETKAENEEYRVVLWDLGTKNSTKESLLNSNCTVITVPAGTTAKEIAAYKPDGIVISEGPGNPEDYKDIVDEIKKLFEYKIPMFGICLGHQLMAIAHGAKTAKLHYGHRGSSQPVRDQSTDRIYITSQNHGYYVLSETLPKTAYERYVNINDKTCEGIEYTDKPAFSVQFQPKAALGPDKLGTFYGKFVDLMKEGKKNASK